MNTIRFIAGCVLTIAGWFAAMPVLAETFTVGSGTVYPGETVSIDVTVDTGANTAGAAFKVTYNSEKLTLDSVSSTYFGTFASQNISPTSIEVDGETYTQPIIENKVTNGSMIAGARTETDGTTPDPILFTLNFSTPDEATPDDYPIGIVESVLNNPAAGYDTDTAIPMLVGYSDNGTPGDPTDDTYPPVVPNPGIVEGTITIVIQLIDTDGDGIDDNWEIANVPPNTTPGTELDIFSATGDFDDDGYTDYQEYLNRNETDPEGGSYDPTVINPPYGTGYTTDTTVLPAIYHLLLF